MTTALFILIAINLICCFWIPFLAAKQWTLNNELRKRKSQAAFGWSRAWIILQACLTWAWLIGNAVCVCLVIVSLT